MTKSSSKTGNKNARYSCTCCDNKTTHRQAILRQYHCQYCGSPLKVRAHKIDLFNALGKQLGLL